jgi:hypothetical protein
MEDDDAYDEPDQILEDGKKKKKGKKIIRKTKTIKTKDEDQDPEEKPEDPPIE